MRQEWFFIFNTFFSILVRNHTKQIQIETLSFLNFHIPFSPFDGSWTRSKGSRDLLLARLRKCECVQNVYMYTRTHIHSLSEGSLTCLPVWSVFFVARENVSQPTTENFKMVRTVHFGFGNTFQTPISIDNGTKYPQFLQFPNVTVKMFYTPSQKSGKCYIPGSKTLWPGMQVKK